MRKVSKAELLTLIGRPFTVQDLPVTNARELEDLAKLRFSPAQLRSPPWGRVQRINSDMPVDTHLLLAETGVYGFMLMEPRGPAGMTSLMWAIPCSLGHDPASTKRTKKTDEEDGESYYVVDNMYSLPKPWLRTWFVKTPEGQETVNKIKRELVARSSSGARYHSVIDPEKELNEKMGYVIESETSALLTRQFLTAWNVVINDQLKAIRAKVRDDAGFAKQFHDTTSALQTVSRLELIKEISELRACLETLVSGISKGSVSQATLDKYVYLVSEANADRRSFVSDVKKSIPSTKKKSK